jgi:glycosyltransferase involved in cell wall biosynthesis
MGFLSPYPWLARLLNVERVFFTDHGSKPEDYTPSRAPAWKRLAGRLINCPLTGVVCVSDYGLRCMRALDLLPAQRFTRIYNAVDRHGAVPDSALAAAFRRRYSIPADRLLVTQVSWMIPEKGIADLLQAAQIALRHDSNLHFALVGEGAFRSQYSELAARMGIDGHVTWTGTVEDPFAAGVYAAADIVCQVSRWEEAFGYVIAEAMAWGKPVIGTRVGGIPEVICDGETGFLVEKGNSPEIAAAILRLARAPELRHRLGEMGALAAATKFDVTRNVSRLLEFYGVTDGPGAMPGNVLAVP